MSPVEVVPGAARLAGAERPDTSTQAILDHTSPKDHA
jgi:hypothetical protein